MHRSRTAAAAVAVLTGLAGLAAMTGAPAAAPADRAYVGVSACGACHPRELAAWQQSAHARAAAPETLGRRAKDAACLACHATGDGADPARQLPGVQCEACHGAGAAYALDDVMRDPPLARALGLRDLSAAPLAGCASCHRGAGTKATPFDAATAWKKIAH